MPASTGRTPGPAITFLIFAPAANILALSYTGVALGAEFAVARVILSLVFGVGIGMIMAALFHREELARAPAVARGAEGDGITRRTTLFLAVLVALLIGGTLKVDLLTTPWWGTELPMPAASAWQAGFDRMLPVDTLRGEEGLTLQGAVLIGLLGLSAW